MYLKNSNMAFKDLDTRTRYDLIRAGVRAGITKVSDIERLFDEGGHLHAEDGDIESAEYYPANTGAGRLVNKIVDQQLTKHNEKTREELINQGWDPDKIEAFYGLEAQKQKALKESALKADIASSLGSLIPGYGMAFTAGDLITDVYSKYKGNPNVKGSDIALDVIGLLPFIKPLSQLTKTRGVPKWGTKLSLKLPLNTTKKELEQIENASKFYNNVSRIGKITDAVTDSFDREW